LAVGWDGSGAEPGRLGLVGVVRLGRRAGPRELHGRGRGAGAGAPVLCARAAGACGCGAGSWILLRGCGVDARWDEPATIHPRDWTLWVLKQLRQCDYVLVVADRRS